MLAAARVLSRKALDCSKLTVNKTTCQRSFTQLLNNVSRQSVIFHSNALIPFNESNSNRFAIQNNFFVKIVLLQKKNELKVRLD